VRGSKELDESDNDSTRLRNLKTREQYLLRIASNLNNNDLGLLRIRF
jgi:hypothetical protein